MQNGTPTTTDENLSQVIKIDQPQIQQHPGEMVRESVQETLNGILDAEADRLCDAGRYEHAEARTDQRTGHERHEDKASGFHRKSRFRIWSQGSNKS